MSNVIDFAEYKKNNKPKRIAYWKLGGYWIYKEAEGHREGWYTIEHYGEFVDSYFDIEDAISYCETMHDLHAT